MFTFCHHFLPLGGERVIEEPVVVEKSQKGVLFGKWENGEFGWFKSGDEKTDHKYVGEIRNGLPNGQGTWTHPDGLKYVGEFKDGTRHGHGTHTFPDGKKGIGEWKDDKPWNILEYDKYGNITGRYVNGVNQ